MEHPPSNENPPVLHSVESNQALIERNVAVKKRGRPLDKWEDLTYSGQQKRLKILKDVLTEANNQIEEARLKLKIPVEVLDDLQMKRFEQRMRERAVNYRFQKKI